MLRIEVIVHNTKAYRWGRSLPCFPEIITRFRGILERFVDALSCLNACFVSDQTLEQLPQPAQIGQTKVGGIDLNKPRMRRVVEAVLALSASPAGFTATELARQVHSMSGLTESEYGPRRAAYDIKKFRAKGMVRKIEITPVRGSLGRIPIADRSAGIGDHQAITRRQRSARSSIPGQSNAR